MDEEGNAAGDPVDLLAHQPPNAKWEDGFRPVDVDFDACDFDWVRCHCHGVVWGDEVQGLGEFVQGIGGTGRSFGRRVPLSSLSLSAIVECVQCSLDLKPAFDILSYQSPFIHIDTITNQ